VEQVALVVRARRPGLLRAHRHRLRPEDLEDCLGQAVLELVACVRGGQRFASRVHLAHVLEQRFLSRVHDRRRALGGRSPLQAALEGALPLGGAGEHEVEVADPRAEVHTLVMHRLELRGVRELAPRLSSDQRLVLASQVALGADRAAFCEQFGWSFEKYRKVAQRARARLRELLDAELGAPGCDVAADPGEPDCDCNAAAGRGEQERVGVGVVLRFVDPTRARNARALGLITRVDERASDRAARPERGCPTAAVRSE
jgi:DNA-directed RNA polymerase specialized sigma24 family protein